MNVKTAEPIGPKFVVRTDDPKDKASGRSGADGGYTKLLLLFLIEGKTIAGPSSAARTG